MPDPERMKAWSAALRSGDYGQATGKLHILQDNDSPEGFCCLGVLSSMAADDGACMASANGYLVLYDNHGGMPPGSVREWAGLGDHGSWLKLLSQMNDAGQTFAKIADEIDRYSAAANSD